MEPIDLDFLIVFLFHYCCCVITVGSTSNGVISSFFCLFQGHTREELRRYRLICWRTGELQGESLDMHVVLHLLFSLFFLQGRAEMRFKQMPAIYSVTFN